MHARGTPSSMRELTDYGGNLCQTVVDELRQTVASLMMGDGEASSQPWAQRLIFDPGLGFAKTPEQSVQLLASVRWLRRVLGGKLLIGASRKSMLGAITGLPTSERLVPSAVAAALAAYQGADVVRVHDVPETVAALKLTAALRIAAGEGR
jgi:dihydropteroate synthase